MAGSKEYREYQVEDSGGKRQVRVKRGGSASPAYWRNVKAAEARGMRRCGYGNHDVDQALMSSRFQCDDCRRVRLGKFSNYRPPRVRQSLTAIAPAPSRAEVLAAVAAGHAETAEVFESKARLVAAEVARADLRESALKQLAALQAPLEPPSVHAGGFNPLGVPETPDPSTTSVEPIWRTEDLETQARLNALRQRLSGEQ